MSYIKKFQKSLNEQGFDAGAPDGDFGKMSYRAAMSALGEAGMKDNKAGKKTLSSSPYAAGPSDNKPTPSATPHKIKIPATKRNIKEIIWHCAATPEGRSIGKNPAVTIDRWHRARGWSGIGYHAVVDLDGKIYLGRNWGKTGAHVKNHNTGTLGFSYVGGVTADGKKAKDTRTEKQRSSMLWLTKAVTNKFPSIKTISTHNQYAAKACASFQMPTDELANINGFKKGRKR